MSEADLRTEMAACCRRLAALGLVSGSSGNLSVRHGTGMLITPTGGAFERAEPGDMVAADFDGTAEAGVPSSEWEMHAELYRAQPDCGAVVHAHPDHCVALSCVRRPIPAFHYMIAAFGGDDVPCTAYHPFGSSQLAHAAAEALTARKAALLGNHGMICRAPTLGAAAELAVKLETLARQYHLALQVGEPALLTAVEMEEVSRRYQFYGRARPR